MASIDRMDWHAEAANFPSNLPDECAGTHIGMYLAWIIENGLIGEIHQDEAEEEIQKVLKHEWTGRDFLIKVCDEKFWEEDLSGVGKQFTDAYYGGNGYYQDYEKLLPAGVYFYTLDDSWENYKKVRTVIDKRYEAWQSKQKRRWLGWLR